MAVSFFVARTKLTDEHHPVGSFFVRAHLEPMEHPGVAAKNSHDRLQDGEVFLNAIQENPPKE